MPQKSEKFPEWPIFAPSDYCPCCPSPIVLTFHLHEHLSSMAQFFSPSKTRIEYIELRVAATVLKVSPRLFVAKWYSLVQWPSLGSPGLDWRRAERAPVLPRDHVLSRIEMKIFHIKNILWAMNRVKIFISSAPGMFHWWMSVFDKIPRLVKWCSINCEAKVKAFLHASIVAEIRKSI